MFLTMSLHNKMTVVKANIFFSFLKLMYGDERFEV